MAVFQTEGDPPSIGRTSLVTIGWTTKTRAAEVKMATANRIGTTRSPRSVERPASRGRVASVMKSPVLNARKQRPRVLGGSLD